MRDIKTILILLSVFCLLSSCGKKASLHIAGDSTAQSYDLSKTSMCGWGQMLPLYTDGEIEIINNAKAGRSTKSFREEGRWDSLMVNVKPNDWVIIQFAHNDTSTKPERHASPEEFRANLIRFAEEVRAKKAYPLLLTPLVMCTFIDGNLVDNRLKTYPGIIREVAHTYQIPMIDVNLKMRDYVLLLGPEDSQSLFVENDDTHTNVEGARLVAGYIAEGIKELRLKGLYKHFR